jgi:hypothetical protein
MRLLTRSKWNPRSIDDANALLFACRPAQQSQSVLLRLARAYSDYDINTRSKPHLNVGTIGHVDHGKTTLTAAITKASFRTFANVCPFFISHMNTLRYAAAETAAAAAAAAITLFTEPLSYTPTPSPSAGSCGSWKVQGGGVR